MKQAIPFRRLLAPLAVFLVVLSAVALWRLPRMYFPEAEWASAPPAAEGLDAARLQAAIDYLAGQVGRDGADEVVVVRRGRVVWQGPQAHRVHGLWSCAKSFTGTALGLLVADGRCALDSPASSFHPPLRETYAAVTLRHLVTMTSGYRARGDAEAVGSYRHGPSAEPFVPAEPLFRPGEKFAYWDSGMNLLGGCLTVAAGEPLDALLQRRIMTPIGIPPSRWHWSGPTNSAWTGFASRVVSGAGNSGALQISALDLARFGHLLLNRGRWKGQDLLPADWVRAATSVQVPAELPDGFPDSGLAGSGVYGYGWWVNGTDRRLYPDAPPGTFKASGFNNNRLWVVPAWRMVIVRLGLDQAERRLATAAENEFLRRVGEARR